MCYMDIQRRRVGVRELRQNLSVYLRRVARGERLEVTDRGHVVAVLAPALEAVSVLDRLVAEGRATPPKGNLLELGPPRRARLRISASAALEEIRSDRV